MIKIKKIPNKIEVKSIWMQVVNIVGSFSIAQLQFTPIERIETTNKIDKINLFIVSFCVRWKNEIQF